MKPKHHNETTMKPKHWAKRETGVAVQIRL